MSAQPIKGFPLADDYGTTRVPNSVLGRVLAEVEDPRTLKLILRAIWLLERQRGYPRFISVEDLRGDRILAAVINDDSIFSASLASAIARGVLLEVSVNSAQALMLNTESARRVSSDAFASIEMPDEDSDGWDSPTASALPSDAFRAYEENIGVLSPMIRENILTALEDFTDEDIAYAVRIAVESESRSWSFVAGVLRRWLRDGVPHERSDGKTGRTTDRGRVSETQLRKYLDEQRQRSRTSTS